MSRINLGIPLHFPWSRMFLYIRIKNQRHDRKMYKKTLAVILLIIIYPTICTYCRTQTQTGTTVPLSSESSHQLRTWKSRHSSDLLNPWKGISAQQRNTDTRSSWSGFFYKVHRLLSWFMALYPFWMWASNWSRFNLINSGMDSICIGHHCYCLTYSYIKYIF